MRTVLLVLSILLIPSMAHAGAGTLTYFFSKPYRDPNVYHDAPPGYWRADPDTLWVQYEREQPYTLRSEVFPTGLALSPDRNATIFLAAHRGFVAGNYTSIVTLRLLTPDNRSWPGDSILVAANITATITGPRDANGSGWELLHFPLRLANVPPGARFEFEMFLTSDTAGSQAAGAVDLRTLYSQNVATPTNSAATDTATTTAQALGGPLAPACSPQKSVCTFVNDTVRYSIGDTVYYFNQGMENSVLGFGFPVPLAEFRFGNQEWPSRLELPLG